MEFKINDKAIVKKSVFGFLIQIQNKKGESIEYRSIDYGEGFEKAVIETTVKDVLQTDILKNIQLLESFKIIHYIGLKQKNLLLRNQGIEYAWEKGLIYKYGTEPDPELEKLFSILGKFLETRTIDASADMDFHEAMSGESWGK
jgi:hypothetical protein